MQKFCSFFILIMCYSLSIVGQYSKSGGRLVNQNKPLIQGENLVNQLPSDFPLLSVKSSNPDSGFFFVTNGAPSLYDTTPRFLMILDNSGKPFYYQRLQNNGADFHLQPNGLITYWDILQSKYYALDSTFSVVDSFYCKNGYHTDPHELLFLPNGHFLLIGDDTVIVNMEQYTIDGNPMAMVIGNVIQEQDENRNVVFEWKTLDHFKITDATEDIDLTFYLIDYCHMNSIEMDTDGDLIVSSRNLDEITKISRQTGDIIWRLGGKNNEFKFINDSVGFSHQHDFRRLPNGNVTLFDDGNLHFGKLPSRVIEYKMDETDKTIELVWQYIHEPAIESLIMGNLQQLQNGNKVIGWGLDKIAATEIDTNSKTIFELTFPPEEFNYRALKYNLDKSYYSSFVPKLKSPANNENVPVGSIKLLWKRNKFSHSFHLQVASDPEFKDIIVDDSLTADTTIDVCSFSVNLSEKNSTYYWRVLSYNNDNNTGGFSGYPDIWSFNTFPVTEAGSPETLNNSNLLEIYPNPADKSTRLTFNINNPSLIEIALYNELGILVNNISNSFLETGKHSVNIDLNNLSVGSYYLQIKAGSEILVSKLIVIR